LDHAARRERRLTKEYGERRFRLLFEHLLHDDLCGFRDSIAPRNGYLSLLPAQVRRPRLSLGSVSLPRAAQPPLRYWAPFPRASLIRRKERALVV
jgi:hypothetical protein